MTINCRNYSTQNSNAYTIRLDHTCFLFMQLKNLHKLATGTCFLQFENIRKLPARASFNVSLIGDLQCNMNLMKMLLAAYVL